MDERLVFDSTLTLEEIEQKSKDVDLFSGIMGGLQEAYAHAVLHSTRELPGAEGQ